MENKTTDERMAKIVELLQEMDRKYMLLFSSPENFDCFVNGTGIEMLSLLAYGLNCVIKTVGEQEKAPSKHELLASSVATISSIILKAWKEEEEE